MLQVAFGASDAGQPFDCPKFEPPPVVSAVMDVMVKFAVPELVSVMVCWNVLLTSVFGKPTIVGKETPGTPVACAFTMNPLVRLALWLSGLVTVIVRAPVAAVAAIVILAVSCVALLYVQKLTVMSVVPKPHFAPLWKFVPVRP